MNAIKTVIGTASIILITLGVFVIIGNLIILRNNIVKKRHDSFIPLVGTILFTIGMVWLDGVDIEWYHLLPLVFDLGGIPMLTVCALSRFIARAFPWKSHNQSPK